MDLKTILLKISIIVSFFVSFWNTFVCANIIRNTDDVYSHVKVLDGFEAYCDSFQENKINIQSPISYKLLSMVKTGSIVKVKLSITPLVCKNNQWLPSDNNKAEIENSFKDDIGQVIKETIKFHKEQLVIQDREHKVIETQDLKTLFHSDKDHLEITITLNSKNLPVDALTGTKYVDIVLKAERIRKTQADYIVNEVNWGNYRLHLNNLVGS